MSNTQLKLAVVDMPKPQHNQLLAAVTKAEADRLFPYLEPVSLSLGETLIENKGKYQHAYFPTTAIVSLMYVEPELAAEVAIIGNDGIVGIPLFLGDGVTAYRAAVYVPGQAYRLEGQVLKREFERAESFRSLLLRYALTRLRQAARPVATM